MADDEFIKIRKKISERQKEVAKELEQGTSDSVLDIFTLDEFLNTSRIMSELSEEIKEKQESQYMADTRIKIWDTY